MVQYFFHCLIRLWLDNPHFERSCRLAIDFYYWTLKLKTFAFLPGDRKVEKDWRISQLRKWINKMPVLSSDFIRQLSEIDSIKRTDSVTREELEWITIKRENLDSLIHFLRELKTEDDVIKLRSMLSIEKDPRPFFKLKRNRKLQ